MSAGLHQLFGQIDIHLMLEHSDFVLELLLNVCQCVRHGSFSTTPV